MKLRFLVGSIVFFMVAAACGTNLHFGSNAVIGSGKRTTETRQVSGFDKVMLEGSGEVRLTQGEQEALTVEADDNILPLVRTEVVNGRLELGYKPGVSVSLSSPIIFTLTVKDIHAVTLAGSGKMTAGAIKSDSLALSIPGSGNIEVSRLDAPTFTPNIAGSGKISVLDGTSNDMTANLAGSGELDCGGLKTSTASITVAGSGNVIIWVTDHLTARVLGSGDIRYYGSPAKVDMQTTGSGSIQKLGNK